MNPVFSILCFADFADFRAQELVPGAPRFEPESMLANRKDVDTSADRFAGWLSLVVRIDGPRDEAGPIASRQARVGKLGRASALGRIGFTLMNQRRWIWISIVLNHPSNKHTHSVLVYSFVIDF